MHLKKVARPTVLENKAFCRMGRGQRAFPVPQANPESLGRRFPFLHSGTARVISLLEFWQDFSGFSFSVKDHKKISVHTPVEHFVSCLAWTRATLPINNNPKKLIINAENSKREGKQNFPARTSNESTMKAISTLWVVTKPFHFFFLCWEFSGSFGCMSPNDGPAAPRGTSRMLPDSGENEFGCSGSQQSGQMWD